MAVKPVSCKPVITLVGAIAMMSPSLSKSSVLAKEWNAGEVVQSADVVAVVTLPHRQQQFITVSAPEVFPSQTGVAKIYRISPAEVLVGESQVGAVMVFVHPPSNMHDYATITSGEMLLFLRAMSDNEVDVLRKKLPPWAGELPDTVWTLAHEKNQWMSWIQFSRVRDTHRVVDLQGRLVAELKRRAGVEPTKEAIVAYVSELVAIRGRVLSDQPIPPEHELDVFQQDVRRTALAERERRGKVTP